MLGVLENEKRLQIIRILLKFDRLCLSDIARELEKAGYQMRLPGVVKHVQRLEEAKILRSESGSLSDEPDARKTIYSLQGKERAQEIIRQLDKITNLLASCTTFNETAKLALRIQANARRATEEEIEELRHSIARCESKMVNRYLTEEEKGNIELWKMMLPLDAGTRYPSIKSMKIETPAS